MLDLKDEIPVGVGLDRSQVTDSAQQQFDPKLIMYGKGPDGMPVPETRGHLPLVAPLSPETFVCLADESEFVLRSRRWGEIVGRFKPSLVTRAASGEHYVHLDDAVESGAPWLDIWRAVDFCAGACAWSPCVRRAATTRSR